MTRGASLSALAAAVIALATPAAAQVMAEMTAEEEDSLFRRCRAAAFLHVTEPDAPDGAVPRHVAQTLLEQVTFVMAESMRAAPSDSLADVRRTMGEGERFFIDFAGDLAGAGGDLRDRATRERALVDCVSVLWAAMGPYIDYLMAWRRKAIDAPAVPEVLR